MCIPEPKTIWWDEGLWLIDQTQLPLKLVPLKIESIRQLVAAIKSLSVRGAPALGAAGAYSIALAAFRSGTRGGWGDPGGGESV